MTWADGPAQLVLPNDAWLRFGANLALVLAAVLLAVAIFLTLYSRIRNGHWLWEDCPYCRRKRQARKRARVAKRLEQRRN
jgi:hypothetical protein